MKRRPIFSVLFAVVTLAFLSVAAMAAPAGSFVDDGPGIAVSTRADVKLAANLGFKLVRIPFNAEPQVATIEAAVAAGLKVVVDFHPGIAWYSDPFAIYALPHRWATWASTLRAFGTDDVAFEVLNEPRMKGRVAAYDSILAASISAIREVNVNRWIVISCPQLGDPDWYDGPLLKWKPPKADRLIATLHYYRPFRVTHPEHYLAGLLNPTPRPLAVGEGSRFDVADWANRDLHVGRFVGWASEHGVVPWIGEAGCYETVPDRVSWFRAVAAVAKAHQVRVCWWKLGDRFGARPGQQKDAEEVLSTMLVE